MIKITRAGELSMCTRKTFSVLIFVLAFFHVASTDQVDTRLLNHTLAKIHCNDSGGLYQISPTEEWRGYIGDITPMTSMKNGQSAWISGYAKLSMIFTSWIGCYNVSTSTKVRLQNDDSFYLCTEGCKGSDAYIGIRNKLCACLTRAELTSLQSIADISCSYLDPRFDKLENKNDRYLSVYQIVPGKLFTWDKSPQYHQCVAVRVDKEKPEYTTKSCYSAMTDVHGYMCKSSASGPLNYNCSTSQFCILGNTTSWFKANRYCYNYNGRLMPYTTHKDVNDSNTYWSGMFRSFKIVSHTSESDVCLSVTKVKSKLIIEPDNCASQKLSLCKREQYETNKQTPPTTRTNLSHDTTTSMLTSRKPKANNKSTIIQSRGSTSSYNTTSSVKNATKSGCITALCTNDSFTDTREQITARDLQYNTTSSQTTKTNDFNALSKISSTLSLKLGDITDHGLKRTHSIQTTEGKSEFEGLNSTTNPNFNRTSDTEVFSYALFITIFVAALIIVVLLSILIKLVTARRSGNEARTGNLDQPAGPPSNNPIADNIMVLANNDMAYDMINLDTMSNSSLDDCGQYDRINLNRANTVKAVIVNEYDTTRNVSRHTCL